MRTREEVAIHITQEVEIAAVSKTILQASMKTRWFCTTMASLSFQETSLNKITLRIID